MLDLEPTALGMLDQWVYGQGHVRLFRHAVYLYIVKMIR